MAAAIVAPALVVFLVDGAACARKRNRRAGVLGCHGGGLAADATITKSVATINPGDVVTFTLTIHWASSSMKAGGPYITAGGSAPCVR